MVIAAAGKLDHERLVELAAEAFTSLPADQRQSIEPAAYRGGEFRQKRKLEQVHLVLGFDAVGYLDPDYYTALLLSNLFGGGMSSRLFQEIRENRGLVYSIYSFVSAYADGGLLGIYAGTGESEVAELLPVVCEETCKLTNSITEEELARSRTQLKASILMSRESSGARAEQLGQQILAYGRPLPVEEIVAQIEAIDLATLQRFAVRLLAGRPTLASLGPIGRVERLDRLAARLA